MTKTSLPDRYSLGQLYAHLLGNSGDDPSQGLSVLERCLARSEGVYRELGDSQNARKLFEWVATTIRPLGDILVKENPTKIRDLLSKSTTAFTCLRQLQTHYLSKEQVGCDALLSIVSYTDVGDPWTQEATRRDAEQILAGHQKQVESHDFLINHILEGFIRSLFSVSQMPSVTRQGRKAITQTVQKPHHILALDTSEKPWKSREVSAMTVLKWTVRNMDESTFQKNWHLCIPPLLTLLDDSATVVRMRGLEILVDLLQKMSSKILQQTGLGEVFEDAVMPTLLFLPDLTPISESVRLIPSAYLALSSLGEVRYPGVDEQSDKMKFMDRVMRQGVLQGFIHSGDNMTIAELLLKELITVIDSMGIYAVKYLKDIIPILSKILADPFGPSHPSLLLAAAKATQTTVANCWPRMKESQHRIELVTAFAVCWTGLNGEMGANDEPRNLELEAVKHELRSAGKTLVGAASDNLDMRGELQPLVRADPSLGLLFGMDSVLG